MCGPRMKRDPSAGRGLVAGGLLAVAVVALLAAPAAASTAATQPAPAAGGLLNAAYHALHSVGNWLVIGMALFLGRFAGKATSRARAPMVVGYLLAGVVLGKSLLNVIDDHALELLEPVASLGLGIVAFMIGTELSSHLIRRMGTKLIVIMLAESLMAFLAVFALVWVLSGWLLPAAGMALASALIFGAMAPASAPAGTVAVIQEYRAKGPLTSLLLGIVGLDDGFAILIYAFAAAGAKVLLTADEVTFASAVVRPSVEILGGLAVGCAVGLALSALLRRSRRGDDVLIYSVGAILLATGLANVLGLSLILANLAVGTVLANTSKRETERAYDAVGGVTGPIYVLFFVIAGAHLDIALIAGLSLLGPVYIIGRSLGLIGGAYVGGALSGADRLTRRYLGLGILSQAGVAIGLALTVAHEFAEPAYGALGAELAKLTINTIAATTIIFEIVGPITTKIALTRAGEIGGGAKPGELT